MAEAFEMAGGGRLNVEPDGGFVRCEATRVNDGLGIYKVWLAGAEGELLLGTLAPEGGMLRLCRRVSRDSLVRANCWPVMGGRCVLTHSFARGDWAWEAAARRMTDPVLRRSAQGVSARIRGETDGFRLAVPFDAARPFPLTPAFCFARVEPVEGQLCAVFRFDGRGWPKMQE